MRRNEAKFVISLATDKICATCFCLLPSCPPPFSLCSTCPRMPLLCFSLPSLSLLNKVFGFYEELLSARFPHSSYKLVFVDNAYQEAAS